MCQVISMELALSNCEVVKVPQECIKYFCFREDNGWAKEGKLTLQHLDKLEFDSYNIHNQLTGLEALKFLNDITNIEINYDTCDSKIIHIDWQDDNEWEWNTSNKYQTTEQVDDLLYINFKLKGDK